VNCPGRLSTLLSNSRNAKIMIDFFNQHAQVRSLALDRRKPHHSLRPVVNAGVILRKWFSTISLGWSPNEVSGYAFGIATSLALA